MTIAAAARALVAELEAAGIPDPLGQRLTLATTLADLCRLAGEEPPAAVGAVLDRPACLTPRRGSRADHRAPFAAADD